MAPIHPKAPMADTIMLETQVVIQLYGATRLTAESDGKMPYHYLSAQTSRELLLSAML
jgi:hypothetical protein